MECRHTGNILLWETSFRMSHTAPLTYQYAVVNEEDEVVKWSAEPVTIRLPDEVPEDAVIQITDVWEVGRRAAVVGGMRGKEAPAQGQDWEPMSLGAPPLATGGLCSRHRRRGFPPDGHNLNAPGMPQPAPATLEPRTRTARTRGRCSSATRFGAW